MLVIRKAQLRILDEGMLRRFEDEMLAHLAAFSPPLFNVLGEEQMREAIRFGFRKSDLHGFSLRGPIRLYLELMLLFGSHFDTDPQYPWASAILNDRHAVSEMQRAEWLYEKTVAFQARVSGLGGANTRHALSQLLVTGRNPESFPPQEFEACMHREMQRVFPEKAEYVGEAGLNSLISAGRESASRYGFPVRGEMLLVVLKFAFGHGCADDPLYPWIGRTLNDDRIVSGAARAERLERKSMTWLEHVLGNAQPADAT